MSFAPLLEASVARLPATPRPEASLPMEGPVSIPRKTRRRAHRACLGYPYLLASGPFRAVTRSLCKQRLRSRSYRPPLAAEWAVRGMSNKVYAQQHLPHIIPRGRLTEPIGPIGPSPMAAARASMTVLAALIYCYSSPWQFSDQGGRERQGL